MTIPIGSNGKIQCNLKNDRLLNTSIIRAILIILIVISPKVYSGELGAGFSKSMFINSAVQFGYTFNKGSFYGFQLSVNYFIDQSDNVIGVTNGLQYYSNEKITI